MSAASGLKQNPSDFLEFTRKDASATKCFQNLSSLDVSNYAGAMVNAEQVAVEALLVVHRCWSAFINVLSGCVQGDHWKTGLQD
jgi:hypothetical protein